VGYSTASWCSSDGSSFSWRCSCRGVDDARHIDPPDPTWVGGYWNDDDFDYAVDAILHHAAVPPASAPAVDGLCWITVARIEVSTSTESRRGRHHRLAARPAARTRLVTALPNS